MKEFHIRPVSKSLQPELQRAIDGKTKPQGSLGILEEVALHIGLIQQTLTPKLQKPAIVVFAADHGIAREGVSAYPQEVTRQMVLNFLNGGAAINVFCRHHGIDLHIVDAGVDADFPSHPMLIDAKIARGTRNFLHHASMTLRQAEDCLAKGAEVVRRLGRRGCTIIGFGEMGIGNTSSASILMSVLCKLNISDCVGRGTGLHKRQVVQKVRILTNALKNHPFPRTPLHALATFGGFEIAQMCGAMLRAAEQNMVVVVDGFIATTALLVASRINRRVLEYAIFSHQSGEKGHAKLLNILNAQPLLRLKMRLGEGTGCALAYPLIQSAVAFLNSMASFESAAVSQKA